MDISNKSLKMEQLSPNHKRSLSDNPLHASSEDMEMEPLSPSYKRVLTHMAMGDSSNIGYEQFSEEVVDTSQIKSHSQEISSQTGLDPHLVRFLSDDLENNKDSLETSYPKDSPSYDTFQETEVLTSDYPMGGNTSVTQVPAPPNYSTVPEFRGVVSSIIGSDSPLYDRFQETKVPAWDVDRQEWENSSVIQQGEDGQSGFYAPSYGDIQRAYSAPSIIGSHYRAVSPPLRRRYQRAPSSAEVDGRSLVLASEDGIGSYHYGHRPPSRGDLMDDFENDNNANPAENTNQETLSKKMENLAISAQLDELNYTRASNVTVSNFVSVKLCGKSNYHMWRTQMVCLMRIHNMLGLVDDKKELPGINKNPELTIRYENLLNGWLIGSLNEEIIKDDRIYEQDAKGIWHTIEKLYDPFTRSPTDSILLNKIEEVETRGTEDNAKLKKKLHNATLEAHWWKAKSILEYDVDAATWAINDNGDTLLHVAVREGNNYFLRKLLSIINNGKQIEKANSKGQTALHIAAIVGNEEAAELLVEKRKELLEIEDKKSQTPLACAYLHKQVNAFVYLWKVTHRSIDESLHPKKWAKKTKIEVDECLKTFGTKIFRTPEEKELNKVGKIGESLLHTAIFNKEYDLAKKLVKINPGLANEPLTLVVLTRNFPSQISFKETLMYPSLNDVCHKLVQRSVLLLHSLEYLYARAGETLWKMRRFKNKYYYSLFPVLVISLLVPAAVPYLIYQLLCLLILLLRLPVSMLYFILWKVLAFLVVPIKNIEKRRMEHKEAKKFLKFICSLNKISKFDKFYEVSLMEAACLDVYEVLDQILKLSSIAMKAQNKDGHNIIQLAVLNRSAKVYNLLTTKIKDKRSYMVDAFNNNLLHFAGRLAPLRILNCTSGAALQLQRELQWYEEVKKLLVHPQHIQMNVFSETPEMVFSKEQANFVQDGEKWMKATAESCSITAALIITIVFAAAITVPGGSNQDTGIPLFKRKVAFNIFAVADAVSLFSASTSLLVFLSILTSRFIENDFLITLPRRLFVGLCLLFLSTTAMMLAFSTILFLVFCDERPWMLAPIGGLTCIPIAAIVTLQLPLVIDLYQAISITIFHKEPNEEDEEEENRKEKEEYEEDEEEDKEIEHNMEGITIRFLKRLSTACCLTLHRENKPSPKRSSTKFCLPLHRGNL